MLHPPMDARGDRRGELAASLGDSPKLSPNAIAPSRMVIALDSANRAIPSFLISIVLIVSQFKMCIALVG